MEDTFSFWSRWWNANELTRVSLVKTLTLPATLENPEIYKHQCATLINSYLSDLADFMEAL